MIGALSRHYVFIGFRWGKVFLNTPYNYDAATKRIVMVHSKIRIIHWYYNILCNMAIELWLFSRSAQLFFHRKESQLNKEFYIICSALTVGLMFPTALQVNILRAKEEIREFIHQMLNYFEGFGAQFIRHDYIVGRGKKNAKDVCGVYLRYLYCINNVLLVMFGTVAFLNPQLPMLTTSILLLPGYFGIIQNLIQAITITVYLAIWFGNMYLQGYAAVVYIYNFLRVVNELRIGRNNYTTKPWLRTPTCRVVQYKQMYILAVMAVFVYCPILLPANKWLFLVCTNYCLYGAIRMKSVLAHFMLFMAMFMILYLLVVFSMIGKMFQSCQQLLARWKFSTFSKVQKRILKGCRPIRFTVGPLYFADNSMVLSMTKYVLESTVDLLVTLS